MFFESIESDKLSDLEFFNILQKNVKSSYNHKDNIKDPVYYKIINGYVNNYTSNSIKFFYCINKSTYNNFYIEEINDEDCIRIYIKSKNKKLYLKINDINITDNKGANLLEKNFIDENNIATVFKKVYCKDNNKFYLLVKSGIYINDALLDTYESNKYFVIDNQSYLCKLVNNKDFNNDNDSNRILKYWK